VALRESGALYIGSDGLDEVRASGVRRDLLTLFDLGTRMQDNKAPFIRAQQLGRRDVLGGRGSGASSVGVGFEGVQGCRHRTVLTGFPLHDTRPAYASVEPSPRTLGLKACKARAVFRAVNELCKHALMDRFLAGLQLSCSAVPTSRWTIAGERRLCRRGLDMRRSQLG
jgi:hypothetical protein